jgi:hypothetical protein
MKRSVWLELSPYGYEVLLYKGSWKQMAAYCKTQGIKIGDDPHWRGCHIFVGSCSIIWLPEWSSSLTDHGVLVHECIHACMRCLEICSVPVERSSHEALAYLVEDLYKQCAYNLGTFNTSTLDKPSET